MYYFIRGKYVIKSPALVVIESGGVGYEIKVSLNTYTQLKDLKEGLLYTYFHVKEDIQQLYGFSTEEEKQLFVLMIGISGIGPSTALMVFSSLSVEEFKNAVLNGSVGTIQSVKGIGGKTAQRLILELKDKMGKEASKGLGDTTLVGQPDRNAMREEALAALIKLGIPRATAEKNLSKVLKNSPNDMNIEELIKMSLRIR